MNFPEIDKTKVRQVLPATRLYHREKYTREEARKLFQKFVEAMKKGRDLREYETEIPNSEDIEAVLDSIYNPPVEELRGDLEGVFLGKR